MSSRSSLVVVGDDAVVVGVVVGCLVSPSRKGEMMIVRVMKRMRMIVIMKMMMRVTMTMATEHNHARLLDQCTPQP